MIHSVGACIARIKTRTPRAIVLALLRAVALELLGQGLERRQAGDVRGAAPGDDPFLGAARAAATASSPRCFLISRSRSLGAPTLRMPTPPWSLPIRSRILSRS